MANRITARTRRWILAATVVAVVSTGWTLPATRAAELQKLDTSLRLIPHNAAFYSSMLRNREQIEAIANSRAWAKLMASPYVQMGWAIYREQAADPSSPAGMFEAAMLDPEVRKLVDLGLDMLSHEVFVYGDEGFVGLLDLAQQVLGTMQYGPMLMQVTGEGRGMRPDEMQGMLLLAILCENLDLLKVPDLIVGFKLSDVDRANEQLKNLEMLVAGMLAGQPELAPFKDCFGKTEVGGHHYLTLTLDGKMVPWHELPLRQMRELEAEEGNVDALIAHLKKSKLVIALGVRDDYLLLSIGSSTRSLARLGTGKGLVRMPELKPLEKFADRRLVSISYISRALMAQAGNSEEDIDDLLEVVNQLLPLAELKPEQAARIRKDAADLAKDVKRMIPEAGALTAFSFLTDSGIEGYQYSWGEQLVLDGSQPLGILQHLGGSPLLAVAGRSRHSPDDYELLVKWIKVAYGYVREFALPELNDREREQFERVVELFGPLVERADQINREMLVPALADGQAALVIDAELRSKQFIQALPPTAEPMPMIEPALVIGVADADLLRKAIVGYRDVLNGVIDAIRQMDPDAIPEGYRIPSPQASKTDAGTVYNYPLPPMLGVDEQISPSFGLSDSVAAVAISKDHVQRLISTTPLAVGGVLEDTDRPLATAGMFDFAGLIDAVTPWVNFAVDVINQETGNDILTATSIRSQVNTVLEVLKVLRTITGESYFEDGALVTHTLVEIRDIE